jgi:EAL domain-containing protein (putative c-di-GMP-specific phosphodiesterase class I)
MYLQPQVDQAGQIVGAEALLRWSHPERGQVPPASFIPVAEDSGLIVPLGEWVLREACRVIARLETADLPMRIAVNVSPRQFRQPDFVQRVRAILAETGADPTRLILEVTEGLLMEHAHDPVAPMLELAGMGLRFSIDDPKNLS